MSPSTGGAVSDRSRPHPPLQHPDVMLRERDAFYESEGISPTACRSRSGSACSDGSADFREAKASFLAPCAQERQGLG